MRSPIINPDKIARVNVNHALNTTHHRVTFFPWKMPRQPTPYWRRYVDRPNPSTLSDRRSATPRFDLQSGRYNGRTSNIGLARNQFLETLFPRKPQALCSCRCTNIKRSHSSIAPAPPYWSGRRLSQANWPRTSRSGSLPRCRSHSAKHNRHSAGYRQRYCQ